MLRTVPVVLVAVASAQTPAPVSSAVRVEIAYRDAAPVLDALRTARPEQLAGVPADPQGWRSWVSGRDAAIRARLDRGDEDSLLNFLLFGTSFTRLPRALNDSARLGGPERAAEIVRGRVDDMAGGILAPGDNERLQFARRVAARAGIDLAAPDARPQIARYLRSIMTRVVGEEEGYVRAVQSAQSSGRPAAEFLTRSTLFASRGLSSDTSLLPSYAVDVTLGQMKAAGVLAPRSVRRVAVIGPGLDFTDKAEGYDFYPPQTMQPFALIDSLVRLDLAAVDGVRVTTFDVSPRVNAHIAAARQRARGGGAYTLELARNAAVAWQPGLADYWRHLGDQIGEPSTGTAPPRDVGRVEVRAVRVRPNVVLSVVPEDLDIVLQRLDIPKGEPGYDLIVGTNVFVYYDAFEQALALTNVAAMLRPGGLLLSNNALPERLVPAMVPIQSTRVIYSPRPGDGDQVVWYRRR